MSTSVKRKAEDTPDISLTRPPPPIPHAPQQYNFCPPGPMPMDFRAQQWMTGGGPGPSVWGGPRMMPNQFFHRGRGGGNQRMFYSTQSRGMRMPPQNYNFNPNMWNRPPPPFMDGMAPPPQGVEGFHNAGTSWMPNTNIPPPIVPHSPSQTSTTQCQFDGTMNNFSSTPSAISENGDASFSLNNNKKKSKKDKNNRIAYNSRPWNRDDAEKALILENECQRNSTEQSLVIRFPDPELSKEIVKNFHSSIESVHFQAPSGGRFCFAQLVDGANVDKVISDIEKIKFGVGKLKAERKQTKNEDPVIPEAIDPYTLYVGNLPTNISTQLVKEKFPTAHRIDIGYAAKMKYTRYAFIRYQSAETAMEAYKSAINMQIASRSIILRFRRHKGPVGPPGESQSEHLKTIPKVPKIKKEREELEEDDEDDDDDDDDDDEDDDDDDDDDDEEDGDVNNAEEDYDDDDDDEEEDEDDDEEDDDEDEEDEPVTKEEESDDDDDDKDDKYPDPF